MKKSDIDRILGRSKGIKETKEPKREEKEKDGALAEVAEWLDDKGMLGKLGNTYLDFSGHGVKGLIKGVEGIYDAGAGIVGAVGGIFDSDFKDDVGEHIKHDYTGEWFDELGFDEVSKKSYLEGNKVGEFAREAWGAVGNMLPSVGLAFIPAAGPAIAMATTGMSAGGQAMESALDKGAGYYGSLAYGTGVGLVEAATEKIGGFVLGDGASLIGKKLAGTKLGKFTSKGFGKVAETFISEAGEEVISDLSDPALQYITGVDRNIGANYKETVKNLPKTALLGGTVGSIMQGGNVTMSALRNSDRGGFKATRADEAMSYIGEVSKNYGKEDTSKNAKYDKAINDALHDISRELTSMSPEARKNYTAKMGAFKNAFNAEDGSIKMDLRANINEGAVSNGLRGISGVLAHKPVSYDTEISEGASKAKTTIEKLLGDGANVVITSDKAQNNAFYNPDEGIVYINNNAEFEGEEIAEFVATHEVAHITEGTKEYISMQNLLEEIARDPNAPQAVKDKIGNVAERQIEIGERYKSQMGNMSPKQIAYLIRTELNADLAGVLLGDDYFIEKLAQRDASLVKKIFNHLKGLTKKSTTIDKGSAKYLDKLVSKFGKAIDKSQGGVKISQLGREDEETEQSEVDEVRYSFEKYSDRQKENWKSSKNIVVFENENQYRDFIEESIENKQYKKKIYFGAISDELANIIKNQTEIDVKGFNCSLSSDEIRKIFKDHGTEKTEKPRGQRPITEDDILNVPLVIQAPEQIKKSHKLYDNKPVIDFVKNFDTKMTVSAVVSNKHLDLRVQTAFVGIKKGNLATPIDEQASINTPKASRGTVSDISISENGEKINTFDKKIDDERKSISKSVDSDGNSLSAGQAEYFKDSKVRDENGNLLVVYHGSEAVFNEFKHRYINTHGSQEGRGFYFTDSVNMARGYKKGEGQLLKGYVNISKPLSDTALTLTRKEVASLIKAIDPTGDDLIANYDTGGGMGYPSRAWYNRAFNDTLDAVMNYCDTDSEVLAELRNAGADEEKLLKTVRRTLGYDGYITSEKYENAQIFVAFESNQFKNADNTAPTDNPDIRYSISKNGKFTPARYTQMSQSEDLIKELDKIDESTCTAEEAALRLGELGYTTGIDTDNVWDMLDSIRSEVRDYATSEREAYRESNKRDKSLGQHVDNELLTEEDANKTAKESLDYWVNNGDFTQGSVRYVQNGKVKVKLAQTANEAQLVKYINNHIMDKKYSNKDVKNIIDDILANSNIWGSDWSGSYKGVLKGETMKHVKKMLWAALNTAPEGERMGAALDIADYIVKYGILAETVEVTEDVWQAHEVLNVLKPYMHNIDISHIKGDVEAKYDKDRTPYMTWALKKDAKDRGYTADEVGQALEDAGIVLSGGRGKLINEADIFIAIHELYKKAHTIIKEAAPQKINIAGAFSGEAAYQLKQNIAREILVSYDKYGQETTFTKVEKKYQKKIEGLKKQVKDVHEENRLKNAVLYEVQKIKDSKSGKYHNATETQDKALSGLKDVLSKIKYRSDINRSSTREIMKELSAWYTEDNPVLQNFAVDVNKRDSNEPSMSQSKGLYSPYIKSLIDLFLIDEVQERAGKPLDVTELEVINQILHHMNFVFESYGKIWRGGRWVEATDVASEQLNILKETRENETTVARLLKQGYFNFFMDPELVCARLDGHDKNGYFTTLLEDLRQADIKQRHDEMLALQRYDEFEKKHKKYIKELMSEKNTVKVGNVINPRAEGGPTADILEIPRYAAIDLYMVSKTRGALETFAETGWRLRLDSGKGKLETPQATITEAQIKGIEAQLSKEDLELIEIMEEQYNVNLRRLKYDTDMIRLGMSNVFDGYYYPINRISANNLDSNDFFFDLERVSNSSFNNSRVKGAKQAIIVSNVLTKFKKHVNGVTRYANLSIPIENMTKLLNIDVGDNANMPQSITMLLRETKDGQNAEKYIKTLIKDAQQINIQTDDSTKVVSFLRGAYAKSTLGFNPKVLFTQASSYIAGFGELRGSSLAYGIANIYKQKGLDAELDKYCPWAAVRHYEKGTTRAMTVTDKVNKAGDFFTKGIEFMDRQIVKLEFLACQKEAQARFNLKIGTEENKIKAGELLQELGLKTQQNQLTTEKSAAMRSPNEFAKTLTMFKADSMKQVSRFLESISAISILKKKMDAANRAGDTAKYNELNAEYKRAQKSFCKYSTVIIASSVYMVLLARLFNKLYHKEEEDENKVLGFFEDLFGNICGMVPIISELYAFFVDGFEVNSFLYSTINNAMDAVKGTTELVSGIVNGENITSEDAMTRLRKLAYSIGALAGFPIKNVYKNTKALIDIVSPSFGDRVDSWFKEPSQKELEEKIEAGIEKGDDKAVSVSLSLLYDKYDLELKDNVLRQEYDRLMRLEMTKGEDDETKYSPLEAKIPDSIKIDGEEVEMERKDVNVFKNAFGEAEKSQAKIVKTVTYKKLNDEQRAYALRKINQYYFESTKYTYTKEKSSFSYYAKIVGIENLALIVAYAKDLKGDARLSRRQKIEAYIRSLHLNSVQTSLALRCLGYGDKENDKVVASYVSRASVLTKEERAEMLEIIK